MRALVPVNNVIARNCENHRLKKLREVDLFIQTLVYIRRFTTSLCCNCFVLTGLSKLTAVFTKSPIMRGHEEGEGRRRIFFHVLAQLRDQVTYSALRYCLPKAFLGWWHTDITTEVKENRLLFAPRHQHPQILINCHAIRSRWYDSQTLRRSAWMPHAALWQCWQLLTCQFYLIRYHQGAPALRPAPMTPRSIPGWTICTSSHGNYHCLSLLARPAPFWWLWKAWSELWLQEQQFSGTASPHRAISGLMKQAPAGTGEWYRRDIMPRNSCRTSA